MDKDALQAGTAVDGDNRPARIPWWFRLVLVVLGLAGWFGTQKLIGERDFPEHGIGDKLLEWSAPANTFLLEHPAWADGLLIVSSALIDAVGIFLLTRS